MIYCGRFAPSPSGALHLGSLLIAVASYLEAKQRHGLWKIRIEDLDTPRCVKGADRQILGALNALGFVWDGEVDYQSQHIGRYQQYLEAVQQQIYACDCSRKRLNQAVYDRYCYHKSLVDTAYKTALRIKTTTQLIAFEDAVQGVQQQNIAEQVGDFIIRRKDGIFAYQFAVVIDDKLQQITNIVRGVDLLDSTPRQIYLQQQLGFKTPLYLHIPLLVNQQGHKLSKQNYAPAIDSSKPLEVLQQVMGYLGQTPLQRYRFKSLDEFWQMAIVVWDYHKIPQQTVIYE